MAALVLPARLRGRRDPVGRVRHDGQGYRGRIEEPAARLFAPDGRQLGARVTCTACGHTFPLFDYPLTATLGVPGAAVAMSVPERARTCPECHTAVASTLPE